MAKSGLIGPFPLTEEEIDNHIDTTIAAFALGRMEGRRFLVQYVGRSDKDAAGVLKGLVGDYEAFKYRTYVSTRRAYAKECKLFHDFSPGDNGEHPEPPSGIRVACPIATCSLAD
ncbi:MAG: hypothetical protein QGH73_16005 [Rhodospirillales bacterium]|jgi:hypothetical protein|nr:hypothetical protein [Rhodospirillaceae bacterium]MDP6426570.1 hypothetical protein [Rhodospirillales bacterium]MDP6644055.1 hypothetical protein [Rhodospirillales bacterium]MDP6843174.1 hypothetical protein [Rhodospirillales bacterium]